jgi:hypothetical protein
MSEAMLVTREHAFRAAQNAVRNQGYAVAAHGSWVKDLDLIAVPWQETAIDAETCASLIAEAIPGNLAGAPEVKPYGRLAWTIYPKYAWGFDRWYVDLSVLPRVALARKEQPDGRR